MMKSIYKQIVRLIVLILLASGAYLSNNGKTGTTRMERIHYLPSGMFLKSLALGYDEVMADLAWIRAVAWIGDESKTFSDSDRFSYMIEIATVLDPMFQAPYEVGGLILASESDKPDEAIALLKKGIENVPTHNPRYWLLPFYLGYTYMIQKSDMATAAKYLELTTSFAESPKYLPLLIARLYANAESPETGLAFIEEILKNSVNPYLKKSLEKRARELVATRHILFLEKAVATFIKTHHRSPSHLNELVSEKIIGKIPEEPLGGTYYISEDGEVLSSTIGGKLKIYKRKS